MTQFNPNISELGRPIANERILMASSSVSASTAISVTNFDGIGAMFFMNITSAFPISASTDADLAVLGCPLPRTFNVVASLSTGATSKEVVMSIGMITFY